MNNPASGKDSGAAFCSIPEHKNEKIIFFCFTNNCCTPLCQECIQMHREYHEEMNEAVDLKPFSLTKEEAEKSIQKNILQVEERIVEIKKIVMGDINQINRDLESLSRSRNLLLSVVNDYFNEIELEYKRLVVDKYRNKESLAQKVMGELSSIRGKLKEHLGQIQASSLCLEIIEKANLSNYTLDIEGLFKSFLDIELEDKRCQVQIHSELISGFRNKLKEYIKIEQNPSIYLSFGNSVRSPENQQMFLKKAEERSISLEAQVKDDKEENSSHIRLAETAAGTSKLLTKSADPEDSLAKSTYSAEWEKTINSKESQTRSNQKLKKSKKKAEEEKNSTQNDLLQSEEHKSEFQDNEAEEVMTEHTVYSSETDTGINGFDENHSNAESSVISELSENAGFEEINMSPALD